MKPESLMEQKKANQERGRKYGGSSSFVDTRQPSKAPRQDEDGKELIGSGRLDTARADGDSPKQGISNRPANEEHAFPDSGEPETDSVVAGSVESAPKQVGGNRGGV
jgi:hypothetical protein